MSPDLGEGNFNGPATDEPSEDIDRVSVKIRAEEGLRPEFPG
jgi:hypothetical protein